MHLLLRRVVRADPSNLPSRVLGISFFIPSACTRLALVFSTYIKVDGTSHHICVSYNRTCLLPSHITDSGTTRLGRTLEYRIHILECRVHIVELTVVVPMCTVIGINHLGQW